MSFWFRDTKAPPTGQQLEKLIRRESWERSTPQDAVDALKLEGMLGRVPIEERSILEMTKIVLRRLLGEDIRLLRQDLEDLKRKSTNTVGIDPVVARDLGWIEALFVSPNPQKSPILQQGPRVISLASNFRPRPRNFPLSSWFCVKPLG